MSKLRIVGHFVAARWMRSNRSRAAIERRQRRLVARHLRFLRRRSSWFRGAAGELGELPLMDKSVMMAHFDELNTVGVTLAEASDLALAAERDRSFDATLRGVSVGLSSGTSGHRGVFLVSPAERDAWAGTVLARTLPPGRLAGHRIALFLRAGNTLYDSVRSRAVEFRYFDLYGDLAAHARELERYRPTILVAPPSVLTALLDAGLELRPQRVYSVAEVLTDADAARLAPALGQPFLHQLYQCTEGFLAHSCAHGTLHLNEDIVLIEREYLDAERFVPIVTDFSRRAQPIVRYRLNDILVARLEPCPCGSALAALDRIEGREDDTLLIGGRRVFADLVTRAMIAATGFSEYRVIQRGPTRLEVQLDELAAVESVKKSLENLWARLSIPTPELEFTGYSLEPGRKLRRVERAWQEVGDEVV